MSRHLGRLLARPLSEDARHRAFAAATVALLVIAAALTLIAPPPDPQPAAPTTPATTSTVATPAPNARRIVFSMPLFFVSIEQSGS